MIKEFLFVFLGGGVGASLRYSVTLFFQQRPFIGTLIAAFLFRDKFHAQRAQIRK